MWNKTTHYSQMDEYLITHDLLSMGKKGMKLFLAIS